MPERVVDQATMEPPKFERCSILLTFQKLMMSDLNRTTELWTKQAPARRGGGASGPSGEAPRGGHATFRLRADHTQLGRAVLFCSLSQLAKPVLRSVRVKTGFPPWGPHVSFRRGQTLVREGSPLVAQFCLEAMGL